MSVSPDWLASDAGAEHGLVPGAGRIEELPGQRDDVVVRAGALLGVLRVLTHAFLLRNPVGRATAAPASGATMTSCEAA